MVMHVSIPRSLERYFWDVDINHLPHNPLFVIQRLLDKGNTESVSWVLDTYDKKTIIDALTKLRDYSPKVANFWRLFFNIPVDKIVCLQKPYQSMCSSHWQH